MPRLVDVGQQRIIDGYEADIKNFPYQVSVTYNGQHRCGGSIITRKSVITAAHCTYAAPNFTLGILAGTTTLNGEGVRISAVDYFTHPQFDAFTLDNDVSVVILAKKVDFAETIQPVRLMGPGDTVNNGALAIVSGWGSTQEGASSSKQLMYTNVPVIDRQKCEETYKLHNAVTANMVCAGWLTGGRDTCQGDSGGPLVIGDTLIGIVSWGYGCARPNYPGVYTRVSSVRDWVDSVKQF